MTEEERQELVRIQTIFDQFTKAGSWLIWTNFNPPDDPQPTLDFGVIDGWEVLRVKEIKNGKFVFWLHFRIPGFQEEGYYAHTILVKRWNQEDDFEMDLTDSEGRTYHIEHFAADCDPEWRVNQWKWWTGYVNEHREIIGRARRSVRKEHIQIADSWTEGL